ncbi:hypothetical protein M501DRAFT_1015147 [Patellaria atrata CBS 101060]|uniref:Uncharacterized protein n=1 Tax=Patellaria atrata CBS 101060 TaxID=1346257 RepID=A0A9P4SE24_9PEZI|nr:hypothetical protein M501DRAFT_1015147 [Patellaria atrata CBS 101060]
MPGIIHLLMQPSDYYQTGELLHRRTGGTISWTPLSRWDARELRLDLTGDRYNIYREILEQLSIESVLWRAKTLSINLDLLLQDYRGKISYKSYFSLPSFAIMNGGPLWVCHVEGHVRDRTMIPFMKWFIQRFVNERLSFTGYHHQTTAVLQNWFALCRPELMPEDRFEHRLHWTFDSDMVEESYVDLDVYDAFDDVVKDQIKWYDRRRIEEINQPLIFRFQRDMMRPLRHRRR